MAPEHQIKSILAVDCGSVTTTAILIEPMEGEYRLAASGQAPSTYGLPWQDITIGVVAAARQIEKVSGRTLLAPDGGWPITPQSSAKQGVDAFIVVSSAGEPLQVVLAGLMPEITLASALRAAATTYTAISQTLSLDSEPGLATNGSQQADRPGPEARIQALQERAREAILLVGGTDGGATRPVIDMANILSMAMRVLAGAERPTILYAGNSDIREEIAGILGTAGPFKAI
ncbi:MAG TPA: glutamate mutase L, partial [Anaerolineae bacterium]